MPTFTEDELYEAYLRQAGRDPDADPTLRNGTSAEPSDEVLQETIRRGEEATERLRQAGYGPDDAGTQYAEDAWTAADEQLWRQWKAVTG